MDEKTNTIKFRAGMGGSYERFSFVGGRESIIEFLEANNYSFQADNGLGFASDRKTKTFGKNKTLVVIASLDRFTVRYLQKISDYANREGIQPIDVTGKRLTLSQLASILRNEFFGD